MLWSPLPGPAPCRLRPRSRPAPPPGRARWASASLSTRSARRSGRTQGRAAAGPAEAARARARISEPQGECIRTPFHLEAQSALGFVSFFAPTQASETGAGGYPPGSLHTPAACGLAWVPTRDISSPPLPGAPPPFRPVGLLLWKTPDRYAPWGPLPRLAPSPTSSPTSWGWSQAPAAFAPSPGGGGALIAGF